MATYFTPSSIPWQFSDVGDPAASYILYAFSSGASTTPQMMFQDNAGTSAGTTITLDSDGYIHTSSTRHPLWLDAAINYRLELRKADSSTVAWQADNISVFGHGNIVRVVYHDTISDALADTSYRVGLTIVNVKEYASGKGIINATYDVVTSGSGTEDGYEYHDDTIDGSQYQLKLRIQLTIQLN